MGHSKKITKCRLIVILVIITFISCLYSFCRTHAEENLILLWDIPFGTPMEDIPDLLYDHTCIVLDEYNRASHEYNIVDKQTVTMFGNQISMFRIHGNEYDKYTDTIIEFASSTVELTTNSIDAVESNQYYQAKTTFYNLYTELVAEYGSLDVYIYKQKDDKASLFTYSGEFSDDFWYTFTCDSLEVDIIAIFAVKQNILLGSRTTSFKNSENKSISTQTYLGVVNENFNIDELLPNVETNQYNEYVINENKEIKNIDIGL